MRYDRCTQHVPRLPVSPDDDKIDGDGDLLQQVVSFDLPQGFYSHNARVTTKSAAHGVEGIVAENFEVSLHVVHSQDPAGDGNGIGPVGRLSSKLPKVRWLSKAYVAVYFHRLSLSRCGVSCYRSVPLDTPTMFGSVTYTLLYI